MSPSVLPGALHQIVTRRQSLSRAEAHEVMSEILRGQATDAQIAGLLIALSMKGETVEEIVGFAQAIREAVDRTQPVCARARMLARRQNRK